MSDLTLRLSHGPPIGYHYVEAPTEDGRTAVIDFYRHREGFWTVDIADEVIAEMPEGLTAVLVLGLRELSDGLRAAASPSPTKNPQ